MLIVKMGRAGLLLTIFAVLGGGLVAFSFHKTYEQIKYNERITLLRTLNTLIPYELYDNDLFNDTTTILNEALLGIDKPITIYRARKVGQPIAAVLRPVAPDGYNGRIYLLVAINYEGILIGVRILSHQETPGLGDKFELRRSNWILGFNGRSLNNPKTSDWKVKRDDGVFDQLTSATITPRAIVKAVYKTLLFYNKYHVEIFEENKDKSQTKE